MIRPRVAVHKFASCDGCQLAFLDAGAHLLELAELVDLVHFAEAGPVSPQAAVDIAFIEGSISTPEDYERIRFIRENTGRVVTMGACATAGGIQALRNFAQQQDWLQQVYAEPAYVQSLATSTPVAEHIKVDLELWGCPVTTQQVLHAVRSLLHGAPPAKLPEKVCAECKRQHTVCVMVARGEPCLGPVTQAGCGAICPRYGRDCYGCFGPAEAANHGALGRRMQGLGLLPRDVADRFHFINSQAAGFKEAGLEWRQRDHD